MKRFAVTPYSLNTMQKMVPAIDEVQDSLLEKLDEFAGGKGGKAKECDLGDWLHYFAFDVSAISCPQSHTRRFPKRDYVETFPVIHTDRGVHG